MRPILAVLATLTLGGCATAPLSLCPAGQQSMMVVQLLFGRDVGGRRVVGESDWRRFVDREITPRFPDGLTELDASGQWRDPATRTVSREASKVVVIAFRPDAGVQERLTAIAEAYKQRFRQKSVGIVTNPACASF